MKIKQKSEKKKSGNVLRGPKVAKKMKPPPVPKTSMMKMKQSPGESPKQSENPKVPTNVTR